MSAHNQYKMANDQLNVAYGLLKEAIDVAPGGYPSRLMAGTIGRLNPLSLLNLLVTSKGYHDPAGPWFGLPGTKDETRKRRAKHTQVAQDMATGPKASRRLHNTLVRLGGGDIVDDMIWRKERGGKSLPWYKQLGGRVMHNPHTTLLGKALGLLQAPLSWASGLQRGSHYAPATDVATIYAHDTPITEHELGHALDFNRLSDPLQQKGNPYHILGYTRGLARRTLRDLYGPARALPPIMLLQEALANTESHKQLTKALKDKPDELFKREQRRHKVLPAGYGSYIGSVVGSPVFGPAAPIAGMLGGKIYGRHSAWAERKARAKAQKKETDKNKKPDKSKTDSKKAASVQVVQTVRDRWAMPPQLGGQPMKPVAFGNAAFDILQRSQTI